MLVRRFVAWSFSTMFGYIVPEATLVAEVPMGLAMRVRMVAGHSLALGMILANLGSETTWG